MTTTTVAVISRQVKVSEYEAGFSLACTLAVCLHEEWGTWHHMGAAIAIPVAMAFSVHGLNNAKGLGPWNWAYIPARIIVIALGVAYSYQHYYHFLPTLDIGGLDLRPGVAFIMELLTLSALIAHEGHSTRLTALTPTTELPAPAAVDLESVDIDTEPVVDRTESFAPPTEFLGGGDAPGNGIGTGPLVMSPHVLGSLNGTS